MSRLADTTQLITNLASRATKNAISRKSKVSMQAKNEISASRLLPSAAGISRPSTNRFKASGLVATAVQPSKRIRKYHRKESEGGGHDIKTPDFLATATKMQKQLLPMSDAANNEGDNVQEFVKKVKSKVKKKKSKASSKI